MRRWKPLLLNSTDGPAGSRLRLWQGQGHDHGWIIKRIKNRSLLLARAKIGIVQQSVSEIWLRWRPETFVVFFLWGILMFCVLYLYRFWSEWECSRLEKVSAGESATRALNFVLPLLLRLPDFIVLYFFVFLSKVSLFCILVQTASDFALTSLPTDTGQEMINIVSKCFKTS